MFQASKMLTVTIRFSWKVRLTDPQVRWIVTLSKLLKEVPIFSFFGCFPLSIRFKYIRDIPIDSIDGWSFDLCKYIEKTLHFIRYTTGSLT